VWASPSHLAQSGVATKEDLNVKDEQNFLVVQRIIVPKVRKCLETIDEGMQF
jgi:hypothetical protein